MDRPRRSGSGLGICRTSVSRKFAEEINAFLKENGYTKVRLIEAGYKLLKEEAAGNKKDKAE